MRGPIQLIRVSAGDDFADAIDIDPDDFNEEGTSWPTDEEATQNVASGEADGVSVKKTMALPILRPSHPAVALLTSAANTRQRVWVEITDADGAVKQYGGGRGMKVRGPLDQDDVGYGKRGVKLFRFEQTAGASQQLSAYTPNVPPTPNPTGIGTGLL